MDYEDVPDHDEQLNQKNEDQEEDEKHEEEEEEEEEDDDDVDNKAWYVGKLFYVHSALGLSHIVSKHLISKGMKEYVIGGKLDQEQRKKYGSDQDAYWKSSLLFISFFWLRKRKNFPWPALQRLAHQRKNLLSSHPELLHWNILVNHITTEYYMTQKGFLVQCLTETFGYRGYIDFHPESYLIERDEININDIVIQKKKESEDGDENDDDDDDEDDVDSNVKFNLQPLIDAKWEENNTNLKESVWILKPSLGSCGRGIQIFHGNSMKKLHKFLQKGYAIDASTTETTNNNNNNNNSTDNSNSNNNNNNNNTVNRPRTEAERSLQTSQKAKLLVMQKYIKNPVLYDKRKFDIRAYVLIGSIDPFRVFYHKGYLRICGTPYAPKEYHNKAAHVTNFHVARDNVNYNPKTDEIEGMSVRVSFDDFKDYYKELVDANECSITPTTDDEKKLTIPELLEYRCKETLNRAVFAAKQRISAGACKDCQYGILGADLLPDTTGNIWVLEFTKSPAFRTSPDWLLKIHQQVLTGVVDITLKIQQYRNDLQSMPSAHLLAHGTTWEALDCDNITV